MAGIPLREEHRSDALIALAIARGMPTGSRGERSSKIVLSPIGYRVITHKDKNYTVDIKYIITQL